MDLTPEQWQKIKHLFPRPSGERGRPALSPLPILNGIFWKIRTDCNWREIPDCYPSRQTCRRHFDSWRESGLLANVLCELHEDLVYRGGFTPYKAIARGDILVYMKSGRFGFLLSPHALGDWRVSTALLFLQAELGNAIDGMVAGQHSNVYTFRLTFKFDLWPKNIPLRDHGIDSRDVPGPEEIVLYHPLLNHPHYVILTLRPPREN